MYGNLIYSQENACSPFKIRTATENKEFPHILLLDSGGCNMRLKTLNAEHAGAKLVILIRNNEKSHQELVDESIEMLGMMVEIPTLTVDRKTGDRLKKLIKTKGEISLKFQMPIPQTDTVDIQFFIKDNDIEFYQLLKNLKNYILQFEDHLSGGINFFAKDDKEEKAKLKAMTRCLDIVNLFDVLGLYGENCATKKLYNSVCMHEQVEALDLSVYSSLNSCYQGVSKSDLNEIQKLIKPETKKSRSHIVVNGRMFHGSLKPENVFEAICGAFIKSPDNCLFLNNKYTANLRYDTFKKNKRTSRLAIILINLTVMVLLLIIAGGAMVLIYDKIYKRILTERVQTMVADSISNYRTLKDNE